jgi:hypothetical protein
MDTLDNCSPHAYAVVPTSDGTGRWTAVILHAGAAQWRLKRPTTRIADAETHAAEAVAILRASDELRGVDEGVALSLKLDHATWEWVAFEDVRKDVRFGGVRVIGLQAKDTQQGL